MEGVVYLIKKAWCDPLENTVDRAFGYATVGYVGSEDLASRVVESGGMVTKHEYGWAAEEGAPVFVKEAVSRYKLESGAGKQNWNSVNEVLKVGSEFEDLIHEVTDRHGPELTLEALACVVGRWFACQDQSHVNAQGLVPGQLMHKMLEFYFQMELGMQTNTRDSHG